MGRIPSANYEKIFDQLEKKPIMYVVMVSCLFLITIGNPVVQMNKEVQSRRQRNRTMKPYPIFLKEYSPLKCDLIRSWQRLL